MAEEKQETISDIVAELRNKTGDMYDCTITTTEDEFHDYADRIEAAAKRDHALLNANIARVRELEGMLGDAANSLLSTAIKQKQLGNAAAMREFAEYVANYPTCKGCNGQTDSRFCESCPKGVAIAPLVLRARLALSEAKGDADVLKTPLGNAAAMLEALIEVNKAYSEGFIGGVGNYPSPEILERVHMVMNKVNAALSTPLRNCEKYATVDEAMDDFADEALIEEWNALKAGKDRDMLAKELFMFAKWLFATTEEGCEE